MANENENNNENTMTPVGIRLETDVLAAVKKVMADDNRPSVANTVETLLKSHSRIKRIISAETAGASA